MEERVGVFRDGCIRQIAVAECDLIPEGQVDGR